MVIQLSNVPDTPHVLVLANAAKLLPGIGTTHPDEPAILGDDSIAQCTRIVNVAHFEVTTVGRSREFMLTRRECER